METSNKEVFFSIVIPALNCERFIARCLSSVILSARQFNRPYEIIVVDDGSTDRSCQLIREKFPQVRLLENRYNCGFPASINRGVRAAEGAIVVLLNSDIVVKPEFFSVLLQHFINDSEGKIFSVSAKTLRWDTGKPDHLCMTTSFKQGFFRLHWSDPEEPVPVCFLFGGACAIRRHIFMKLGGLSLAFSPVYWEDYDLAYVAIKAGYQNIYEPNALAYHFGEATASEHFSPERIQELKLRNSLIFLWMNITDWTLLLQHFVLLPIRLSREFLTGKGFLFNRALIKAIKLLPEVMYYRRLRRQHFKLTDAQVLARFAAVPHND